jgi:hypothetical protein
MWKAVGRLSLPGVLQTTTCVRHVLPHANQGLGRPRQGRQLGCRWLVHSAHRLPVSPYYPLTYQPCLTCMVSCGHSQARSVGQGVKHRTCEGRPLDRVSTAAHLIQQDKAVRGRSLKHLCGVRRAHKATWCTVSLLKSRLHTQWGLQVSLNLSSCP